MQKQIKAYSCLILSWTLKKGAGDSEDKESACNAGDAGLIPGSGRSPGEGNGNPLQYSCLEISINQRSLAAYSPRGRKESDTTEQLTPLYTDAEVICKVVFLKKKDSIFFTKLIWKS